MSTSFDVGAIREALADLLRSWLPSVQVYAYYPETALNFPCLLLQPDPTPVNYLQALGRGLGQLKFTVRAYTSRTDSGQRLLDRLISAGLENAESVFDAIERDRPNNSGTGLEGLVSEMVIREDVRYVGMVRIDDESQTAAWCAEWTVDLFLPTGSLS